MTEQDYHYSPFLIERNESWIIKKYRKHISKKPFSIGYQTWVGKPFLQLGRFQFDLYYKALIDIENNLAISFDKWIQNNIIYVTQESLQKINVYYMNANLNILNDFISMRRQVYDDTCKAAIGFALGTTSIQDFANLYRQMTYCNHLRWRYTEALQDLVNGKYFSGSMERYKNRVFEMLPQGDLITDHASRDYRALLSESRNNVECFRFKNPYIILCRLKAIAPDLFTNICNYARTYLVDDYEDIRLPVPYLTFTRRLRADLFTSIKNDQNAPEIWNPPASLLESGIPEKITQQILTMVKPENPTEFWNLINILLSCGTLRENEHHELIKINCYAHEALLNLAFTHSQFFPSKYKIFEFTCEELVNLLHLQ